MPSIGDLCGSGNWDDRHVEWSGRRSGRDHLYETGRCYQIYSRYRREIDAITPVPLVLHGGSSNNDEEIHEAAVSGISKVNIASDYRKAFFERLTDTLNETHAFWSGDVYPEAIEAGKEVIRHKMKLFECTGKAGLYK